MTTSYVLIADLEASREITDRPEFEGRLRRVLEGLCAEEGLWHAPLEAIKGIDELSSVLLRPERSFDVAWRVNLDLWPARFRFALGHGEVDLGWETRRAGRMDGPAFHAAAAALSRARQDHLPFAIAVEALSPTVIELVEQLARLHGQWMRAWRTREAETVRLYDRLGNQTEVAARMGITQQAVSDALQRAADRELRDARDAVRAWALEHLAGEGEAS